MHISINKKYLILTAITLLATSVLLLGINQDSFAHQSGCHSWHSCPSDSGSYTCGDKGYCSQCPDNNYCKAGNPISSSSYPDSSSSGSGSSPYSSKPSSTKSAECKDKGTAMCIVGKVKRIIDGDTLVIDKYTIRLALTNTPESNEAGFKEAKAFTSKSCPVGSKATVDQDDGQPTDDYKRIVAKVTCSGKILNSDLLYYKYAKISTQFCKKSEFSSESWAKLACKNSK